MFLGRETYVSAMGNVKNIEKKPPLRRGGFAFLPQLIYKRFL